MGTTLTGTEIKDTYDSLIKVTDNGPISGTAKYLSDGLGNDSALALSTSLVGIGTASGTNRLSISGAGSTALSKISVTNTSTSATLGLAVSNSIAQAFIGTDTNHPLGLVTNDLERMTITSAGKVGIGTSAPATTLHVSDAAATTATFNSTFGQLAISFANSGTTFAQIGSGVAVAPTGIATDLGFGTAGSASTNIIFATGASFAERMRIDSAGNVGIGTVAPLLNLSVVGVSGVESASATPNGSISIGPTGVK
jgi:trimeric autotransporter adhesin